MEERTRGLFQLLALARELQSLGAEDIEALELTLWRIREASGPSGDFLRAMLLLGALPPIMQAFVKERLLETLTGFTEPLRAECLDRALLVG